MPITVFCFMILIYIVIFLTIDLIVVKMTAKNFYFVGYGTGLY